MSLPRGHETDLFAAIVRNAWPERGPKVILDLGSRDGAQAIELRKHFPSAQVYAFECNPVALAVCRSNLAGGEAELVPMAALDINGRIPFFPVDGNIGASSVYRKSGLYDQIECYMQTEITVDATRIDTWAKRAGVPQIDLVWADLQGCEMRALQGMGDLLDRTAAVSLEVEYKEMYLGQPLWPEVDAFMRSKDFVCLWHRGVVHRFWGEAIYAASRVMKDASRSRL